MKSKISEKYNWINSKLFILVVLLCPLFGHCQKSNNAAQETKKELVWSDEFDYVGLPDENKWSYEKGFIRNNEPQYYTEKRHENATVDGNKLVITAHKENYEGAKFTSASINTRNKYAINKGRIEVRAKLPKGSGVWPAIWTLGTNRGSVPWPQCGEIDIMEYWGHNPNSIHANVHTGDYNHTKGTGRGGKISIEKPWEAYHVFAVEWYEDRLDFFMDDKMYYSCKKKGEGIGEWPFDEPQYLLINLALIKQVDNIDESIFPAKYMVDYVRIYKIE